MDRLPSRMPRWVVAFLAGLVLASGAAVAAWSVELPYYAFSPGPVGDALDTVRVEGDLPVFPPDGELFMLTVSVQGVNAYEMLIAAADPGVDLVPRERLRRPGETDEEFTERNLEAMDTSVQTAVAVALDRLGIEVTSDGVEVVDVLPDFPAAEVLQAGDVIRSVEGSEITLIGDLAAVLEGRRPGELIQVRIERDGSVVTETVRLGESEDDPDRPLIGVRVQNLNPRFPVDIEPGNIGGPSAGMMYALAVIDLLTEGDLSRGRVVAGTGTIAPDGTVGPIGGIRQKVVAAEAAGADVMLVPAANYEEALTAPRDDMELVSVAEIDEALSYLDSLERL